MTEPVILIIDDDSTSNFICERVLERNTIIPKVISFTNPLLALQKIRNNELGEIHLILLDLNMPEMNGYQFIERLESLGFNYPVVILTSSSNYLEKDYSSKYSQIKAFLRKPFNTTYTKQIQELANSI